MVYDIKKDYSGFIFLKYENRSLFLYNLALNFWGNSYFMIMTFAIIDYFVDSII
jgi:hypothetical protein